MVGRRVVRRKQISLKQLQRAIAFERTKLARLSERQRLEKELRDLQSSGRTDVRGRIGRGFVILSKKAGRGIKRQAVLIRERQIQQAKTIKKGRRRTQRRQESFAPSGALDF